LGLLSEWAGAQASQIDAELRAVPLQQVSRIDVDASRAEFDLAGAWLLVDFLQRAAAAGAEVAFRGDKPRAVDWIERTIGKDAPSAVPVPTHDEWHGPAAAVEGLGKRTVQAARRGYASLAFLGRVSAAFGHAATHRRRLYPTSIARHVYDTGITAIPIVALIGFLISVILAYIGAQQLQKFGADIFVVDLVTIGVLRELGVLLTAIIVAGRSGSAFAAELGAMKLNEEVDALVATGVNPIQALVLPRLLGLMIALPLLAIIADLMGLAGGALLCRSLLDMPLVQYVNRVNESIAGTTFWVGIIKAPVFAILIAMAGTRCGLRVRGSSRHLGRMTTLAVVQSIFFVILADAMFAVLFMKLDI
jgi:phospholipid/cholesterol/gamma-HCH transport system permease protein